MAENFSNNPIRQMPQITSPDFLDGEPLVQLCTYRFNQSAHTGEFLNHLFGQKIGFSIVSPERSVKEKSLLIPEFIKEFSGAITFISQNPRIFVFRSKILRKLDIMDVSRCQNKILN